MENKGGKTYTGAILVIVGLLLMIAAVVIAVVIDFDVYTRIAIVATGSAVLFAFAAIAVYLENKKGKHVCPRCKEEFAPPYKNVLFAPHVGETRYLKCPHCQKRGWCEKTYE